MLQKTEIAARGWTQSADHDLADEHSVLRIGYMTAMRLTANNIFETHAALRVKHLTQHLPKIAVATVCTIAFVYLLDTRSELASLRQASIVRLDACVGIVWELGELNFAARDIAALVESSVKAAYEYQKTAAANGVQQHGLRRAEGTGDFGLDIARRDAAAVTESQYYVDANVPVMLEEAEAYGSGNFSDAFLDANCLEFLRMEKMVDLDLDQLLAI